MGQISRRTALAGLMAAGLAACSKPDAPAPAPAPSATVPTATSPTPTPSAAPTVPVDTRPRWPLTGELLKDPSDAKHAAVAVKVPDNQQEHPQRGIDKADIVFVELEGYRDSSGYSATRLVPVFHSQMPDAVAPVRSVRPVDVALLSPMDAIIGNTGGSPWVIAYAKHNDAHLEPRLSFIATLGSGSYGTDQSRVYQIGGNTYYDRAIVCHPKILAKQTKRFRSGPEQVYFPIASSSAEVSTVVGASGVSVKIPYKGDDYFMGYRYDAGSKRYLRSEPWGPHVLADGTRVSTDNILIIKAHQHYGKIYKGSGEDEPLHDVVNASGKFYYFNQGRYVVGTWSKKALADPFTFTQPSGRPFKMRAGQTFVELPDTNAKLRIS